MKIFVEGIQIPVEDFRPKKGGVYAVICRNLNVFGAIEACFRLARAVGFDDDSIVAEHFYFQRDYQQSILRKELERLSISGWSHSGAMIVIPGLSERHFKDCRTDEAEIAAFLFCLRKQVDSLQFPVVVPFHSEGLAVDEKLLWAGLATMGFTRVELSVEPADKSIEAMLIEDALDEAASMTVFPDAFD